MGLADIVLIILLALCIIGVAGIFLSYFMYLFKGCKDNPCLSDDCIFSYNCLRRADGLSPEHYESIQKLIEEAREKLRREENNEDNAEH